MSSVSLILWEKILQVHRKKGYRKCFEREVPTAEDGERCFQAEKSPPVDAIILTSHHPQGWGNTTKPRFCS